MSGHHKFSELTKRFTPGDRKIIEAKKAEMRASMDLAETPGQPEIALDPPDDKSSQTERVGG
jgi:hypothetical protein